MDIIASTANEIVRSFPVELIYLYNTKTTVSGDRLKQFDIAVIIKDGDSKKTEKEIYLSTESDVPFVCLCYTKDEWDGLLSDKGSFASHIKKKGQLIYGQIQKQPQ